MVDRDAYLARIGYEGAFTPPIETLRGLHRAHVMTVPLKIWTSISGGRFHSIPRTSFARSWRIGGAATVSN